MFDLTLLIIKAHSAKFGTTEGSYLPCEEEDTATEITTLLHQSSKADDAPNRSLSLVDLESGESAREADDGVGNLKFDRVYALKETNAFSRYCSWMQLGAATGAGVHINSKLMLIHGAKKLILKFENGAITIFIAMAVQKLLLPYILASPYGYETSPHRNQIHSTMSAPGLNSK